MCRASQVPRSTAVRRRAQVQPVALVELPRHLDSAREEAAPWRGGPRSARRSALRRRWPRRCGRGGGAIRTTAVRSGRRPPASRTAKSLRLLLRVASGRGRGGSRTVADEEGVGVRARRQGHASAAEIMRTPGANQIGWDAPRSRLRAAGPASRAARSTGRPRIAWSSDTVGGDTRHVHAPSAAAASVAVVPPALRPARRARPPARWPGGRSATKKAVSKRTAVNGGVTKVPMGLKSLGPQRQTKAVEHFGKGEAVSSSSSRRSWSSSGPAAGKEPSGRRAMRTPVSSNSSRAAATRRGSRAGTTPASAGRHLAAGEGDEAAEGTQALGSADDRNLGRTGAAGRSTLAASVNVLTDGCSRVSRVRVS